MTSEARRQEEALDEPRRRDRLQRVLARLNRLHEPPAPSTAAYSNRTPSPNRQSLYDWAPAYEDNQDESELDAILSDLRRQQPETHPDILRVLSQSQVDEQQRQREREGNATPAPANMTDVAERRERLRERERRRQTEWASLRTRAAIQRSRQEGSPSSTDRMLRYMLERERSGMSEEEERARGSGWFRPSPSRVGNDEQRNTSLSRDSWLLPPPASEARDRERQERVDAFRRGYLAANVPPRLPRVSTPSVPAPASTAPRPSIGVENALKYLSDLRACSRYEETLSTAIDHGLATKEFFADKHDDFIMDLSELTPLQDSSWLQPGSVFQGQQHATNTGTITHPISAGGTSSAPGGSRFTSSPLHIVEQINPRFSRDPTSASTSDHPPGSTQVVPFDAARPWLSHTPPSMCKAIQDHDHWPVRVIIHSIDVEKMTLQGTMEAYDVPQHPASLSVLANAGQDRPRAGKKHAPITTYLEGHIIDLNTHTFLTPSSTDNKKSVPTHLRRPSEGIAFPAANAATDAANWRKLPPFSRLASDGELFRALISKAKMEELNRDYIFMRWKERCFVHAKDDRCNEVDRNGDQDRGHGLTISGFYYISLRRSDGVVEGLYFDPTSTPYQHLRLRGQRTGWPAFELR